MNGAEGPSRGVRGGPDDGKLLWAFYDLGVSPTGFDFATVLALAEMARRRGGHAGFHVVIVPAEGGGFWDKESYDASLKSRRLEQLLIPLTGLMPNCNGVTVASDRGSAKALQRKARGQLFPAGYSVGQPVEDAYQWAHVMAALACGESLPGWRAPAQAQAQVSSWFGRHVGGRLPIVLTLREATYFEEQNSDLVSWASFARGLDPQRYCPIVLRDTERAFEDPPPELEGLLTFDAASLDVEIRAALYERAYLNMMSANGPMQLIWLNPKCRSIVVKLLNLASVRSCPTPIRAMGFEPGQQPSGFAETQRVVWESDTPEALADAFADMVRRIERASPGPSPPGSVESPFATARRLRQTGRAAAVPIYEHLLKSGPDREAAAAGLALANIQVPARVWRLSGVRLWRLRRAVARSIDGFASRDPDSLLELAQWCAIERRPNEAASLCRRALALAPEHPQAHYILGQLALEARDYRGAEGWLVRTLAADPLYAAAHYDLGCTLVALDRAREAAAHFGLAARYEPSHEVARFHQRLVDAPDEIRPGGERAPHTALFLVKMGRHGRDIYFAGNRFLSVPHGTGPLFFNPRRQRLFLLKPWLAGRYWNLLRPVLPIRLLRKLDSWPQVGVLGAVYFRRETPAGLRAAGSFSELLAPVARPTCRE
jgi:tetratricopeptide (TPR) repeat protein